MNMIRAIAVLTTIGLCLSSAALGHRPDSALALTLVGGLVLIQSIVFSHVINIKATPHISMQEQAFACISHVVLMLEHITEETPDHAPLTWETPVVLRTTDTFHPLGTMFAAVLNGERVLVFDAIDPLSKEPHAQVSRD